MERRTFVGASVATICSTAVGFAAEPKLAAPELYELRTISLKPAKQPLLDEYLSKSFIPALKRYGVGPVGVFTEPAEKELLKVYVLIVHKTADELTTVQSQLADDEEYQKSAKEYLAAKPAEPVYLRIESSLLAAIPAMPKMEKPDTSKPRLLNLRIYESHNERAAAKKVEMFAQGELAIFRRVGLTPVLFSSAMIGAAMPNLTYMLVFKDDAERQAAWNRFRTDPEWVKLKSIPEYADKEIVSKITNKLLTPAPYSEL